MTWRRKNSQLFFAASAARPVCISLPLWKVLESCFFSFLSVCVLVGLRCRRVIFVMHQVRKMSGKSGVDNKTLWLFLLIKWWITEFRWQKSAHKPWEKQHESRRGKRIFYCAAAFFRPERIGYSNWLAFYLRGVESKKKWEEYSGQINNSK